MSMCCSGYELDNDGNSSVYLHHIHTQTHGNIRAIFEGTAEYSDGLESVKIMFQNKCYKSPSTRSNFRDRHHLCTYGMDL
jgi:hypothetical protein